MPSYADWVRATLIAREREMSDPDRLGLWLDLAATLRNGRSLVFGAVVPTEELALLKREILPELEARIERVEARGAVRTKHGAEVPLWPARTKQAEALLRTRVLSLSRAKAFYDFPRAFRAAVSGVLAIGFAPGTDHLLVVSAQGLGVFDACTGRTLAQDPSDRELPEYPEHTEGIGPIEGVRIPLMGLDGGVPLAKRTRDGFAIGALSPDANAIVWLTPPGEEVERPGPGSRRYAGKLQELRAAGFSDTGRSFALAEPGAIHFFARV